MNILHLINLTSVGIFGMILSAAFCDIHWTKKKIVCMAASMAALLLFQGLFCLWCSADIVENLYPIITHVPLTVALCMINKKRLWPFFSVLTAYLCCQFRRWLGLLIALVFRDVPSIQDIAELALTLPILVFMVHFVAPSVRQISHFSLFAQCQFGLVPALYYGFDYLTRIYTSLLLDGVLVAVEFMPFVCSAAYIIFVVYTSKERSARTQLEQMQGILNLQIAQAVREIGTLRESQQRTRSYRHDLRHHLQYLYSCIENGRLEHAKEYIREICSEIENSSVISFCENETANLILSAYAGRAQAQGIRFQVRASIPQAVPVSGSDLSVLLSNALENALCACQRLPKPQQGIIEVTAYKKNGKLFLQFVNSFNGMISFDHGIPVTDNPGHGIGVRSICAIADRYGGYYSFLTEGNRFILRVSL